ncbi:MAG: head-tail connector protein [Candidatus Paceibacterota bacterium]|jgi:uncharacterized phiE125 gp8 family phage protein
MNLKLITAATTEPISLTEAKAHLRVTSTDEDTLIGAIIKAARQSAESMTRRSLASQVFEIALDDFPEEEIILPMPPVESITSIKYKNSDGVETTWDSAKYVFYNSEPAKIIPAYGEVFPSFTPYPAGAVKVRFIAGYKTSGADVSLVMPEAIKQALLLLIGSFYENREDLLSKGHIPKSLPFGVDALLYPYRIWGW